MAAILSQRLYPTNLCCKIFFPLWHFQHMDNICLSSTRWHRETEEDSNPPVFTATLLTGHARHEHAGQMTSRRTWPRNIQQQHEDCSRPAVTCFQHTVNAQVGVDTHSPARRKCWLMWAICSSNYTRAPADLLFINFTHLFWCQSE